MGGSLTYLVMKYFEGPKTVNKTLLSNIIQWLKWLVMKIRFVIPFRGGTTKRYSVKRVKLLPKALVTIEVLIMYLRRVVGRFRNGWNKDIRSHSMRLLTV